MTVFLCHTLANTFTFVSQTQIPVKYFQSDNPTKKYDLQPFFCSQILKPDIFIFLSYFFRINFCFYLFGNSCDTVEAHGASVLA